MTRVLVVDDSSFMRKSLSHILESDGAVEVVGTAADGKEALRKVRNIRPDVVLLDIEMPGMDGLSALAHIMAECPTPVLMLSGLNKRDTTIALRSIDHGAVDFIAKPSGVISYDIDRLREEIITKVKAAASVDVEKMSLRLPEKALHAPLTGQATRKKVVVIGASTGGPRAVAVVLSGLPRDIRAAILVVQHMGQEFVPSFVERLRWGCPLEVALAARGEAVTPSRVLVAPGGVHVVITRSGAKRTIRLSKKRAQHGTLPSVDYAMQSAARAYGSETLGVLLTGIGNDGVRGMKAIKEAGGYTVAEDESTSVVFGMPKAAIEAGCVDEVVPLQGIAPAILRMT